MKIKLFLNFIIFFYCLQIFCNANQKYYSQYGQDKFIIEKIFNFKKNGIFFDIGAHDGITFSNTYYLEKNLNWTGICIEPQKDKYQNLIKNRKSICINGCVYKTTGIKDFLQIQGYSEMLSGLIETFNQKHLDRVNKELAKFGGCKKIIKINCYNFNEICKNYDIKKIDFLSIDTEGSEEEILKSIDFENIFITLIAIENNYKSSKIKNFLTTKKYKLICTIGVDEIYQKK